MNYRTHMKGITIFSPTKRSVSRAVSPRLNCEGNKRLIFGCLNPRIIRNIDGAWNAPRVDELEFIKHQCDSDVISDRLDITLTINSFNTFPGQKRFADHIISIAIFERNDNVRHAVRIDGVTARIAKSKRHRNGKIERVKVFVKKICDVPLPAGKKAILGESEAITRSPDRYKMCEIDISVIETLPFISPKMGQELVVYLWL